MTNPRRHHRYRAGIAAMVLAWATLTHASPPAVLATIKPIHSLVAGVMDSVGEPDLLLSGAISPHVYGLRPSDLRKIRSADLLIWIGPALETFLDGVLDASHARRITLLSLPNIRRAAPRPIGVWRDHPASGAAHKHDHRNGDPHIWLDIENAQRIVRATRDALNTHDPQHRVRYSENADRLIQRLDALDHELRDRLHVIRGMRYLLAHDAYQLFENRYGLSPMGSITVSPERQPGAKHVAAIRSELAGTDVKCVFIEPQFRPKLVDMLIAETPLRIGVLDPIGTALPPGPNAYFALMRGLAESMRRCLFEDTAPNAIPIPSP